MNGRASVSMRLYHLDSRLAIVVVMIYLGGRWIVVLQLWLARADVPA